MLLEALPFYLLLGMVAGLLAGMLGVGGGLVIVPVLVLLFGWADMTPSIIMHLALGTSLATIVVTSISSTWAHHRFGAVLWPVCLRLTPGIVLGAWLGAAFADQLSSDGLQRIFGIFELLVALQMGLALQPAAHRQLPGPAVMGLAGGVTGAVSAIVGIGGGTLTVPFLHWCNVSIRNAVATSAACGLPIALSGALGYLVTGWGNPGLPAWSSGYLYWPAFAAIMITSLLFAPLGAHLAHRLPATRLKQLFALFLTVVGAAMLLS